MTGASDVLVLTMELDILAARNAQLLKRATAAESMLSKAPQGSSNREESVMVDAWTDPCPLFFTNGEREELINAHLKPVLQGLEAVATRLHCLLELCAVAGDGEQEDASGGDPSAPASMTSVNHLLHLFSCVASLVSRVDYSVRAKAEAYAACLAEQQALVQRLHEDASREYQSHATRLEQLEAVATACRDREERLRSENLELRAASSLVVDESRRAHVSLQAAEARARQLQVQLDCMRRVLLKERERTTILEGVMAKFKERCVDEIEKGGPSPLFGGISASHDGDDSGAVAAMRRLLGHACDRQDGRVASPQQQQAESLHSMAQVPLDEPPPSHHHSPFSLRSSPQPVQPLPDAYDSFFVQSKVEMLARQIYRRAQNQQSQLGCSL
jgi:hypothetical protein